MAATVKTYLLKALRELRAKKPERFLEDRYGKFRRMGVHIEPKLPAMETQP